MTHAWGTPGGWGEIDNDSICQTLRDGGGYERKNLARPAQFAHNDVPGTPGI